MLEDVTYLLGRYKFLRVLQTFDGVTDASRRYRCWKMLHILEGITRLWKTMQMLKGGKIY